MFKVDPKGTTQKLHSLIDRHRRVAVAGESHPTCAVYVRPEDDRTYTGVVDRAECFMYVHFTFHSEELKRRV